MRHSTTTKHFRFVIEGKEMRNVYAFAGLTFALALSFSLTTAAQTSSTESKQKASPDQSQTDSAGNRHRDRVSSRGVHALSLRFIGGQCRAPCARNCLIS